MYTILPPNFSTSPEVDAAALVGSGEAFSSFSPLSLFSSFSSSSSSFPLEETGGDISGAETSASSTGFSSSGGNGEDASPFSTGAAGAGAASVWSTSMGATSSSSSFAPPSSFPPWRCSGCAFVSVGDIILAERRRALKEERERFISHSQERRKGRIIFPHPPRPPDEAVRPSARYPPSN